MGYKMIILQLYNPSKNKQKYQNYKQERQKCYRNRSPKLHMKIKTVNTKMINYWKI